MPSSGGEKRPPNVLVLLGDTVRADHMSLYGYDRPTTPRIDAYAERGRVYERAIAPGVWTLPAHASLFTGLAVSEHGVERPEDVLEAGHSTLAEIFAAAGYDTFAFSANPFLTEESGLLQGFDEVHFAWDPRWRRRIQRTVANRLAPGDVNSERILKELDESVEWAYQAAGPTAHRVLLRWLEHRPPARPFFAYVNYMEAHPLWVPSPAARARVMSEDLRAHALTVRQDGGTFWMAGRFDYSRKDFEALAGLYDAALVDWDEAVGSLLDDLGSRGLLENTVVVITSDHGESLGEHGILGHQFSVHAPLSHVPLVVIYPENVAFERTAVTTSTADLLPILLDVTGLRTRADVEAPDRRAPWGDRTAVTEYTAPNRYQLEKIRRISSEAAVRLDRTLVAVERDGFRLLRGSDGSTELYDVRADPAETRDVAGRHPRRVGMLSSIVSAPKAEDRMEDRPREMSSSRRRRLEALGYIGD